MQKDSLNQEEAQEEEYEVLDSNQFLFQDDNKGIILQKKKHF